MNWFSKRATEASTWGGLGMLVYGLGDIFKIREAPAAADAVASAGNVVASGGAWWQAAIVAVAGAAMAVKSDGDKGF